MRAGVGGRNLAVNIRGGGGGEFVLPDESV